VRSRFMILTERTSKKAESQLLAIHGTALAHPWTSAALRQKINPIQSTHLMYASITGFCQALLFDFFARSIGCFDALRPASRAGLLYIFRQTERTAFETQSFGIVLAVYCGYFNLFVVGIVYEELNCFSKNIRIAV